MRKLICTLLAALMVLTAVPLVMEQTAEAAFDYSTVRVLLGNSSNTTSAVSAAVKGNYFIQENGASFSNGTLTVQVSSGGIVVTHSTQGQLYAGSSVNIMRESLSPSAGYLSMVVDGRTRSYLGHFMFKYYSGGIRVVNTVPLQQYLYGVVAFEMSNSFPMEALRAQAIAAKCYVLSGISPSGDYDIGDTARDQVYKGYNASYTSVMRAVDETYNQFLFLGNEVLCAYFAASNGGQTILPSDTWSGTERYKWDRAYARVEDPYDIANPLSVQETVLYPSNGDSGGINTALSNYLRNRSTMNLQQTGKIDAYSQVVFINSIDAMRATSSKTADITLTVTVRDSAGATYPVQYSYSENFDYLVSNGVFFKSSLRLYTITPTNGGYLLRRGRYGHGVGLSQRGAEQMGKQGIGYQQILKFYYPGATLQTMNIASASDPSKPAGTPQGGNSALGDPIASGVTTGNVNFRQGASTATTSLGTIPKGTSLYVYGQENGFSLTSLNNVTGYVSNSYLKLTPISGGTDTGTQTPSTPGTVTAYGQVSSNTLNFRDQPNTSGKVLQTLKKGAAIQIYGYANSGWYFCNANNKDGYVSAQYVTISSTQPTTPAPTEPTSPTTPPATITGGETGIINAENVYLRSNPSDTVGTSTAKLQKGLEVTIASSANDEYYAIYVQGYQGYVKKSYINVVSTTNNNAGNTDTGAGSAGQTTGAVNFRTGPGTSHSLIKKLAKGTKLTIFGSSNGWYEVEVEGKRGYISADYVKVTGQSGGGSSDSASGTTGVTTGTVNLRESASTSAKKLGTYGKNTQVTITGETGDWYAVVVGSKSGYMSKQYVRKSSSSSTTGSASTSTKKGVTTGSVNFRSSASTSSSSNIIKKLAKGAQLTILSQANGWYQVTYNGKTGYISADYVKVS